MTFPDRCFGHLGFSAADLQKMRTHEWILLFFIVILVIINLVYIFWIYIVSGLILYYLAIMALAFIYLILRSWIQSGKYALHIHHWQIGFFVCILTGYQNLYISALNQVFLGMMVEGNTRWGFGVLFEITKEYKK